MRLLLTTALCAVSLVVTGAVAQTDGPSRPDGGAEARLAAADRAEGAILASALEAARARKLELARERQSSLSDPVGRRLVDWALADIFAERLGPDLQRIAGSLDGWPRAQARRAAVARLGAPETPTAPVPYVSLAGDARSETSDLRDRRLKMTDALRRGDARAAYEAIAAHALAPGSTDYAEAESLAGWLALNKLGDAQAAERHFARLDVAVRSPVSKARAAYWRGRAAEAQGDVIGAQAFYGEGARHSTTFYGQLAAERAGMREITLEPDPVPTAAERSRFEANELVRAMRLLALAGETSLVRVFGLHLGDTASNRAELALAVDAIQALGEQELALLAYRRGAQRGLILHERGYPLVALPAVDGGAEPAFVLAVVRQESQFDPRVRSGADARGMMQILPGTGREMAQKIGLPWADDLLWDPHTNLRLGSRYLGHLTEHSNGSYLLASAGYNAGPSRPRQWVQYCGDPRDPATDPLDFIECIPFGETRNYVMNVLSNLHVYRARLNGGRAPLTPAVFLRQPRYGPLPAGRPGAGKTTAD